MKKFFIAIALLFIGFASAEAKSGFGVKAGVNFPTKSVKELKDASPASFQLGVAYNVDLPFGLSIQPALQYNLKQSSLGFDSGTGVDVLNELSMEKVSVGYLELMASIQWGIDLIAVRPFLDVSPFVGYAVNGNLGKVSDLWKNDGVNKLDYGVGLGAGLDVWRFQVVCRYSWNFGNLMKTVDTFEDAGLKEKYQVYKNIKEGNFGGLTLTLAYFF